MTTAAGYRDHVADVRGIRFHWLEWGAATAPPMVLLHGLTGHAHIWDHMAPALAERYRVFALDQRGHGDSGHADSYDTQAFVDDLESLRQVWGIGRFVLVGLSMGGHNAIAYAAQHPERVARLVIIDIPPSFNRERAPNWEQISKLAVEGHKRYRSLDEAVVDARAGNPTAPEANLRYRTEWNLRRLDDGTMQLKYDPKAPAAWQPADLWRALKALHMPVLLVRGGKTTVLPLETADRMLADLPDGELAEVPESGHSVPTDRPEDLAPLLLDWLARK
jgi:esterase